MSFVLDIILVVIAAICVISGAKRGFFRSVMSFVCGIAALFISYAFSPFLATVINDRFILPALSDGISQTLASIADSGLNSAGEAVYDLTKLASSEQFASVVERYGASGESVSEFIDQVGVGTRAAVDKVAELVARPISTTLSDITAFIIVFVVSLIVLRLLVWVVGLIFELPVLKGIDKLLGLVFGVVSALLFVWIFAMFADIVIGALSSAFPSVFNTQMIENSYLLRFFAEYNVIGAINKALGF